MRNKQITPFNDTCILYYSKSDDSWIAHSLHTDQIGTGGSLLDALVDIMTGLNDLVALNKKDKSISLFRKAPEKIQKLAQKADPLPEEICQIALRKIKGDWPKGLKFSVDTLKKHFLLAEFTEPLFT